MAQTDKFRKYKSLYSSTCNTFGTGTGVTITPNSVSGLPTDTEITLTFDRIDSSGTKTPSKMERITGTISGGNFTSITRGVEGTEQAHTSPVVEMVWNADDWNDALDGILVQHNQDGSHKAITASSVSASTVSASDITSTRLISASQINASSISVNQTIGACEITASQITTTGRRVGSIYAIGNTGSEVTVNWLNGETQTMTLDACTTLTFSNVVAGSYLTLFATQGPAGTMGITYPAGVVHVGGSAPTLSTASDSIDVLGFRALTASDIHLVGSAIGMA